jgi:hypothetical protein
VVSKGVLVREAAEEDASSAISHAKDILLGNKQVVLEINISHYFQVTVTEIDLSRPKPCVKITPFQLEALQAWSATKAQATESGLQTPPVPAAQQRLLGI